MLFLHLSTWECENIWKKASSVFVFTFKAEFIYGFALKHKKCPHPSVQTDPQCEFLRPQHVSVINSYTPFVALRCQKRQNNRPSHWVQLYWHFLCGTFCVRPETKCSFLSVKVETHTLTAHRSRSWTHQFVNVYIFVYISFFLSVFI